MAVIVAIAVVAIIGTAGLVGANIAGSEPGQALVAVTFAAVTALAALARWDQRVNGTTHNTERQSGSNER